VKGKTLTAEVTAALDGYSAGQASLATAPVAPGAFQPTAQPTIQGTPEVGQTLTLTAPSWSPQPAKVTTQWYADGVAIDGATGSSLVLTRDHTDRRISARTVASSSGYRKARSTAVETTPVLAKPVTITSPSRIKGTPEVGRKLVAQAGTVRPTDASATYAWLRDGRAIGKATNPVYTVRKGDVGHTLSVQITLSRRHFRDTTESVAVPGPVMTVPEVKVRPDVTRKRVAVDIRVRAPGASAPGGAVTVSVGGRTVEVQLVSGRARAVVRDVRPGTRPLVVRYAGTDVVRPAVARSSVEVPRRGK
jgi:hypothetical protein